MKHPDLAIAFCAALFFGGTPMAFGAASTQDESGEDVMQFFEQQGEAISTSKAKLDRKDAPATTLVVSAEEIARFGYRNVAEALRALPGMYVTYDRNYAYLGVRGMSLLGDYGSRVLVMIDGNSVGDAIYNSAAMGNELGVDIDQVKRIEVVLGPGSTDYGSHAMFLVVNIITKDGVDIRGGRLSAGYGSWNSREGKFSLGNSGPGGFNWYLSGAALGAEGQDIYSPESAVTGDLNNGVFSQGDGEEAYQTLDKLYWKDLQLEAGVNWRKKKVPNASTATALYSVWNDSASFTIDQWNFLELRYLHKWGSDLEISGRVYERYYQWEGSYTQQDPLTLGLFNSDNVAQNQRYGIEAGLSFLAFKGDHLNLGGEYVADATVNQTAKNKGLGDPALDADVLDDRRSLSNSAAYLENVWQPGEGFTLLAGLRYDSYSTFDSTLSPRLAFLFHLAEGARLKLLYGTAFSQPNAYAMYNQDNQASLIANPGLKAENVQTYEAVFEKDLGLNALTRVSVYHNVFGNLMGEQDTGLLSPSYGSPLFQWRNGGKTVTEGVDLSLHGDWQGWKGKLGGSFQRSQNETAEVTNSPQATAVVSVSAPLGFAQTYLSAEGIFVSRRLDAGGQWMDDYFLTNLVLFSGAPLPHLELTLKLNNAFDSVYVDPSGVGGLTVVPQDRRNVMAKATLVYQ